MLKIMKNNVPALKGLKNVSLRHASLRVRSESEAKSLLIGSEPTSCLPQVHLHFENEFSKVY